MNLNNIRIVSRASKDLKDPDLLYSTIMVLTTKFPIRVNREIANMYELLDRYLGLTDVRVNENVQCKIEAIE